MDKTRILIVEDEPKLADILSKYLEKADYETRIVADGADAEHAFSTFDPHLTLLDIMLPNVDGIEISRVLFSKGETEIFEVTHREYEERLNDEKQQIKVLKRGFIEDFARAYKKLINQ